MTGWARRRATMLALLATPLLVAPLAAEETVGSAIQFVPPPAKEGFAYPDCFCTDSEGSRVELGERACLRIGGRDVTAICDMSQNTPTWRNESEGCPTS